MKSANARQLVLSRDVSSVQIKVTDNKHERPLTREKKRWEILDDMETVAMTHTEPEIDLPW